MNAPKTLGKPENWQDFESLCKKLWTEIWRYPETRKNGRSGQEQHGVDVYGMPYNDPDEYYGIQCKGKDDYTNKKLTKKEITTEIGKAKNFKPKLKKLYFATTAVRDSKIEEFVREKNVEHKKSGLFEVHVFFWEDIVDLINENKETFDFYVNSINYKTSNSVSIMFDNGLQEKTLEPVFRKKWTHFIQKIVPANPAWLAATQKMEAQISMISGFKHEINHSFCPFHIKIHNTGTAAIENYKLHFEFEGNVIEISDTNEIKTGMILFPIAKAKYADTHLNKESLSGSFIPIQKVLVGDEKIYSDTIYLKPNPEDTEVKVKWRFLSYHFKDEGELTIKVKHRVETEYKEVLVEDPSLVRTVEGEIEDYIIDKEESS